MKEQEIEINKILQEKDFQNLEAFQDKNLWLGLSEDARKELALLFLKKAESDLVLEPLPEENHFFGIFSLAEELSLSVEVLCKIAYVLFRYGILRQKGRYLLSSLDKLMFVDEEHPTFFEKNPEWLLLWGNVLVALSRLLKDNSFVEKALAIYARTEKSVKDTHLLKELYWSFAEGWIFLGEQSQEIVDFQKGLEKYAKAYSLGLRAAHFRVDFGEGLLAYATLKGDPHVLEQALVLFRGVIADTYLPRKAPNTAYTKAWVCYAHAAKRRFELTHAVEHLEEANTIFRDAIMNVLDKPELWLYWGELYLYSGWVKKDLDEVEVGLEKLTSSKIKECEPLKVSAMLGLGLVTLGFFLEDLRLLKEGKERIEAALEISPQHSKLLYAQGFAFLCEGLYFSDGEAFSKAIFIFERNLEKNNASTWNWFGLFQAYMGWFKASKESSLIEKALKAIGRLSHLRPYCPLYLKEWGLALLHKRDQTLSEDKDLQLVEEAIQKFKSALQLKEESDTLFHLGVTYDLLGDLSANEEDYFQSIECLTRVYEKMPDDMRVRYQLALALSHFGELTRTMESLSQSSELFLSLLEKEPENDALWCELGYTLLNQAVLIDTSIYPEKAKALKSDAEKKLMHAASLGNADACYHLACLYSLCGLFTCSLDFLRKASQRDALPRDEDLEHDEWLSGVRATQGFQEFLTSRKIK